MLTPASAATSRVLSPSKPLSAIWLNAADTRTGRRSALVPVASAGAAAVSIRPIKHLIEASSSAGAVLPSELLSPIWPISLNRAVGLTRRRSARLVVIGGGACMGGGGGDEPTGRVCAHDRIDSRAEMGGEGGRQGRAVRANLDPRLGGGGGRDGDRSRHASAGHRLRQRRVL